MWSPNTLVFLSLTFFWSSTQAIGLFQALKDSGASDFALQIQSNPSLSSLYLSSNVQTVFAPMNNPSNRKGKRQSASDIVQNQYQGMTQVNTLGDMSSGSGLVMTSNDAVGNLGGQSQPAVSNPAASLAGALGKRWQNVTQPSLLKVFTGLGNSVNILKADIPYSGGIIHIIDGFFTLPVSLSATASANGNTAFVNSANSSGLTSTLDNTAAITAFIPSNAAFAKPGSSSGYSSTASLLSGHIIPNFLGYLPSLKNGDTFTTQAGSIITVTIQGGNVYLNNAKITASNQIIQNGVAHVIDQVIQPVFPPSPPPSSQPPAPPSPTPTPESTVVPPTPVPTLIPTTTIAPTPTPTQSIVAFTGAGASMMVGSRELVMAIWSFVLCLAAGFLI